MGDRLMARTFFPTESVAVPASPPHPANTQYKISVGLEDWNGRFVAVTKVQMVYDGVVSGRKSPSYPVDTDDMSRVIEKLAELRTNFLETQ